MCKYVLEIQHIIITCTIVHKIDLQLLMEEEEEEEEEEEWK